MNSTTNQFERLAFDGPFSVVLTVLCGIVLLGLFVWSLRLERHILGPRMTWLFGSLRLVALATALWMLLAPSNVRYEETTTRKTFAVVADISKSMQTVDPINHLDDSKWSRPRDDTFSNVADRALAAAILSEQRLALAMQALNQQQSEEVALKHAASAYRAIEQLEINLRKLEALTRKPTQRNETIKDIETRIDAIEDMLTSADVRALKKIEESVSHGKETVEPGWRELLSDLSYQLSVVRRRTTTLAGLTSSQTVSPEKVEAPTARLAKTKSFIEQLEADVLSPLQETADIRYATFADGFDWASSNEDFLKRLKSQLELVEQSEDASQEGRFTSTDLSIALERLRELQSEESLAGVIVLSDVAHNGNPENDPRKLAAEMGLTPVYFVPIGSTENRRDVDLKAISVPGVVMKDDDVVIEATLQSFQCGGETVRFELMQDGQVIQDREVKLETDNEVSRVRFNANLSEVGLQQFQVRVPPLSDELSEINNFNQFEVNVTRDHIDVLIADDLPRWEYRYLAQLFRRDAKLHCDELLFHPRLIATGERTESKTFPTTVDEWDHYDVILLGDVSTEQLTVASQEALAEYLRERGGTLVMIAGDNNMPHSYINQPLEDLLPVTKTTQSNPTDGHDGYAFRLTEEGWDHDALMIADTETSTRIAWDFISQNAPFYALSDYRQPRPSARTLISAVSRSNVDAEEKVDQNALLCWQQIGRGRIVYLASPETYRLRFLRGDRLHYRFWGQLLRWAIASDLSIGTERVAIRTDRPNYESGKSVEVSVQLQDEKSKPIANAEIEAVASAADGTTSTIPLIADNLQPGRYVGTFEKLKPGIYHIEATGEKVDELLASLGTESISDLKPVASFTIQTPIHRELLDTRSDRALAQQLADATGGQVLPPTAVAEIIALTDLEPIVTEKTEVVPLWVQWKYLWIVFSCLFAEWAIRKQLGLS